MRALSSQAYAPASKEMQQQYRGAAEDKLLQHLAKVAAKSVRTGNLEQSNELYQSLVSARREKHGNRHPLTLHAIGALSKVHTKRGEYHAAESLAREATATSRELLGSLHPDSLRQLNNLAAVLMHQGKLDEATTATLETIEGCKSLELDGPELDEAQVRLQELRSNSM